MRYAKPLLVSTAIATAIRLVVPIALESGGERYLYHAMGTFFPFAGCPTFQCFRFGAPLLASLLPMQTIDAFILLGWAATAITGVMMWHVARHFGFSDRAAMSCVLAFWCTWAPLAAAHEPLLLPDPFQLLWNVTAILLLLRRRYTSALVLLVAGACIKEGPVAMPFIYTVYVIFADERPRPSPAWLAVLIAAPTLTWVIARRVLIATFRYSAPGDAAYIRNLYTLHLWLDQLGPWPRNVAIALFYVFAGFGAMWIVGILGLLRDADRRVRVLAMATAPAMIGMALLQEPHRAINIYSYAIVLPSGLALAALPDGIAAAVLATSAALTLRMAAKISWLPDVRVIGAALIVAAAAAVVAFRRAHAPRRLESDVRESGTALPRAVILTGVIILVAATSRFVVARTTTSETTIAAPPGATIADDDFGTPGIAVAPDNDRIVFVVRTADGAARLCIHSLSSGVDRVLPGTDGASAPFWSPAGEAVGFFAASRLKVIDLGSGVVRTIAPATDPHGASWFGETIVFAATPGGGLKRVSSTGGAVADVTVVDGATSHRWPAFLPDGHHFLFVERGAPPAFDRVRLGSLASPSTTTVLETAVEAPTFVASADVMVFGSYDTIRLQLFDTRRLMFTPLLILLTSHVAESPGFARAAVSASDRTLAYARTTAMTRLQDRNRDAGLFWFDRSGRREAASAEDRVRLVATTSSAATQVRSASAVHAQLSPDGRFVAYSARDREFNEVYVEPVPATGQRWLVSNDGGDQPRWRADGRELFYVAENRFLMSVAIADAPTFQPGQPVRILDQPIVRAPIGSFEYAVSADGNRFLLNLITDPPQSAAIDVLRGWRYSTFR
ncbi:MAG TPA: hypothetical protein VFA59_20580 [Vicinamibacterales bacterium]|nr:hypothetical protein [Vicinamibacterales bacterium]